MVCRCSDLSHVKLDHSLFLIFNGLNLDTRLHVHLEIDATRVCMASGVNPNVEGPAANILRTRDVILLTRLARRGVHLRAWPRGREIEALKRALTCVASFPDPPLLWLDFRISIRIKQYRLGLLLSC